MKSGFLVTLKKTTKNNKCNYYSYAQCRIRFPTGISTCRVLRFVASVKLPVELYYHLRIENNSENACHFSDDSKGVSMKSVEIVAYITNSHKMLSILNIRFDIIIIL